MLFYIANALDDPFGFDAEDIKLNQEAAKGALSVLTIYTSSNISLSALVRPNHETPVWLENPQATQNMNLDRYRFDSAPSSLLHRLMRSIGTMFFRVLTLRLFIPMAVFTAWCTFVIVGSKFLPYDKELDGCRWWCPYIPVDTNVTGYVSLAVFLVLAFWLNDTYSRYWSGLQKWQTSIQPFIEDIACHVLIYCKQGLCHPRDRERLLSHLVALPIAAKQFLRYSKDFSELEGILCPTDLVDVSSAANPVRQCFHVILAYWSSIESADPDTNSSKYSPFGGNVYNTPFLIWNLERAFSACKQIRDFQLPRAFTLHLEVFTGIWLFLLPISVVKFYGWVAFAVLIPIGYSIITLLLMGKEFSDPFGNDRHDIPLDDFCASIKDSVHRVYQSLSTGVAKVAHSSNYPTNHYTPNPAKNEPGASGIKSSSTPTLWSSLHSFSKRIPSVPVVPLFFSLAWSIAAVFITRELSKVWNEGADPPGRLWNSPIDVEGAMFGNIGFALFLILAFRASDAMYRYESGADLLHKLHILLRSLAVEFCFCISDGLFHDAEKQRFVAHLVQIPLYLQHLLLTSEIAPNPQNTILSEEDFEVFASQSDPLDYLLDVLRAYVFSADVNDSSYTIRNRATPCPGLARAVLMGRPANIRVVLSQILSSKRHPVVATYTSHQRLFTALWLFLLPLSMIPSTGYYTILWTPIISYGVLALENIAVKLVDPFGSDDIDIPVKDMCTHAANDILESVISCNWDSSEYTGYTGEPDPPYSGVLVGKGGLLCQNSLPYCFSEEGEAKLSKEMQVPPFKGRREEKMSPSLYAHFIHSVPWFGVLIVTIWAVLATIISYLASEERSEGTRWWTSTIIVSGDVAVYVSFAGKFSAI